MDVSITSLLRPRRCPGATTEHELAGHDPRCIATNTCYTSRFAEFIGKCGTIWILERSSDKWYHTVNWGEGPNNYSPPLPLSKYKEVANMLGTANELYEERKKVLAQRAGLSPCPICNLGTITTWEDFGRHLHNHTLDDLARASDDWGVKNGLVDKLMRRAGWMGN